MSLRNPAGQSSQVERYFYLSGHMSPGLKAVHILVFRGKKCERQLLVMNITVIWEKKNIKKDLSDTEAFGKGNLVE